MRSLRLIRFLLIPIWAMSFNALAVMTLTPSLTPSPSPTPSPTLTPSATCPPTGTPNVACDTLTPSPAPTAGPTAIASPTPSGTISPTPLPTLTPSYSPTPADAPTCLPGQPGVPGGAAIDFSQPITAPIDGTLVAPDDDTFFGPKLYSDSFTFTVNQAFGRTTYIRFEVDADPASPSPATGAGTPFQSIAQINGLTGEAHCAPSDPYDRDNRLIEARLPSGTYVFRVGLLTDPTTGVNPPSDYQDYRLFIIAPDQTVSTMPALNGSGALDFGTVDVDGQPLACAPTNPPTTAQAMVTISNPGPSLDPLLHPDVPSLVVENLRIVDSDGNPSTDFIIVFDDCLTTLSEGQQRKITIQFDPQNPIPPGPRFAYLRFETNDPDEGVVDIPLTGVAVDPEIGLDREFIDFGGFDVDGEIGQQTINITNFGSAPLELCNIEILADMCGEFSIISAIPASIAPGATLPVTIQFDPVLPIGSRQGIALRIVSDDTDESVLTIPIAGVSLDQEICVEPLALVFPDQDVDEGLTPTQLVSITNVGNKDLAILNVVRAGVDPIDFKIVSDTDTDSGSTILAPGATRVVGVAFDPKLPIGQKNALLRVTSDDTDEPTVDVTLTGLALDQEISVTGGPLAFGDQDVDLGPTAPQQVTIANLGNTDLALTSIAFAGLNPSQYTILGQTCGATLGAGASCTVDVQFNPTLPTGPKPAALRIVSDDQDEPMVDVALSGTATDQDIDVQPLALDFGGQDVDAGPTATMPVTVTNVGSSNLTITSVTLTGANSGEFAVVNNPCAILAPSASCVIDIAFDPALPTGPKSATLSIFSDDSDEPQVDVALAGTALDQEIEVATLPIDFGTQDVDAGATAPIAVTISNLGNAPLNIASVTIGGVDPADFPVVFDSGQAALAPGDTRVIQITFDPALPTGAKAASITIVSDDTDEPAIFGALTGTAADQEIAVNGPLSFGDQDVDAGPTATQNATITNLGTNSLNITSVSIAGLNPGDFTIVSDTGEAALAPAATRTIAIAFDPSLPIGAKTARIDVVSDDTDEPTVSIDLDGNALDQEIDVSPLSVDFGGQDVDAGQQQIGQTVTVTNVGNATLTITGVALTAGDTGDFVIVNNPCTTLAPGGSCVIDLNFDPSLPFGTKNATLTISSDDTDEPTVDMALTGNATDQEIDAQPPGLAWFNQDVDAGPDGPPLTIQIRNIGNAPLSISSVALAGADPADFAIVGDSGQTVIPPGGSRSVDVVFDPVAPAGVKNAVVRVMSDDADEPTLDIPITGTAVNPEIDVTPPGIEFPTVQAGSGPSGPELVTITNVGTSDLLVTDIQIVGPDAAEFSISTDSGETTLAPSASRLVNVVFTPGLPTGPKTAQVRIVSSDFNEPVTFVDLSAQVVLADIQVEPLMFDFGDFDTTDPASEPTTITITNVGTGSIALSSVSLTGADSGDFLIVSDTGEASLSAGQSRLVFVAFDPTTTGTKTANLTVVSDDPDEPVVDSVLLGEALNDQDIAASVNPVDFGQIDIDTMASISLLLDLSNDGPTTLTISSVSIVGPDAASFLITGDTGEATLLGAQTRTIQIQALVAPPLGARSAFLQVISDDTDETPLLIPLASVIVDPDIDAAPSPLDFGTYDPFESAMPARTLTITNTGTGDLNIASVLLAGPNAPLYTIVTDSGEATLGAGESRVLLIRMTSTNFAPPPNARVDIVSNDTDEPLFQVPLTGTQTNDADIGASPIQIAFGSRDVDAGPSASTQVTIRNDGSPSVAAVNISSVSIVGPDAASFVIFSDTGEPALNPAMPGNPPVVRIVRVQFDPILGVGPKSATLRIISDDVGETQFDIALSGTAVDQEIAVDPLSLSFGSLDVDSGQTAFQTVTITNEGNATLNIASVALGGADPGDFVIVSDTNEAALAPGASRLVDVAFDPNAPGGAKTATLDISSDDTDESVVSVSLSGTGLDQEIDVSPASILFGSQDVDAGATAAQTVTITNLGNATLALSSVALVGPQAGDFSITSDTGETTLGAGATRTLQISFDPALPVGLRTAQLRIASDDTDEPVVYVALSGNAIDQDITVSPLALAFGDQDIDAGPTADQVVTITNDGGSTLTLTSLALGGADLLEFNAGISGGPILGPGQSATVSINFDPSSVGSKNAVFTIVSDDADESTITISLAGVGVDGEIDVTPLSIDFGALDVDLGPATPRSIAVQNVGGSPLAISGIALGGATAPDFSLLSGGGAVVLQPGEIRTVVVGFDPQLPNGAKTGTVDIASDDKDEALVQVALNAVAIDQEIGVAPTSLDFGSQDVDAGATAPQNVVIDNLGNAPLNITSVAIVGPNAADFFIFNDTAEASLGTTETRTVSIAFDPALPFGAKSATLRIMSNDADEPTIEVPLAGLALDQEITVAPLGPLDFGDQDANLGPTATQAVTITNDGNSTLTLANAALGGANANQFTIANGGGGVLAPGASRVVQVAFDPSTTGAKTATLDISSDDTDEPLVSIILNGNGVDQEIAVSPTSLTFPWIYVNNGQEVEEPPTTSQAVTITNSGTGPLTISGVTLGGTDAASFLVTFDSGEAVLPPGASRVVQVGFDPVLPIGPKSATLVINSDDTDEPTVTVTLNGTATQFIDNTLFIAHTIPAKMTVGQALWVGVTVMNNGTTTWSGDSRFLTLIDNKDRSSVIYLPEGAVVSPGQSLQFVAQIVAPAEPGTWNLEFQMVESPNKSFGDTLTVTVQVVEPVNAVESWADYD